MRVEKELMYLRLVNLSRTNSEVPMEYHTDLISHQSFAYLLDGESGVKFRWSPFKDKVWVAYFTVFRTMTMVGNSWSMTKEDGRKLWNELVTLGWECPDGGVRHG